MHDRQASGEAGADIVAPGRCPSRLFARHSHLNMFPKVNRISLRAEILKTRRKLAFATTADVHAAADGGVLEGTT